MFKVLKATYNNNNLILDEDPGLADGQKIKVIIIDDKENRKKSFLEFIKKCQIKLKKGYKFNREEFYDRSL
jgi:predicted DNA-binding antitoxin AbrB/MazE fold protein